MRPTGVLMIVLCLLTSCSSFLDVETNGIVYGDVFIKVLADSSGSKYAAVYYAYGNRPIDSARVTLPGSGNQSLALDSLELRYTFARFPKLADYQNEKPEKGDYRFSAIFSDETYGVSTDYLSEETIDPPVLSQYSFDRANQRLSLSWVCDENAQNTKISLISTTGEILYESDLLEKDQTSLTIGLTSLGWYNEIKEASNDSVHIVIQSYLFEEIASSFDLQCLAVNNLTIILWSK